jgi:hypothetical protein
MTGADRLQAFLEVASLRVRDAFESQRRAHRFWG